MSDKAIFEQRFRRFSAVRRGLLNAALGYGLATLALAALGAGLLLLGGWLPNLFVNAALFVALGAALVTLPVLYGRRRRRFRSCLEEAFRMEELAGGLNSRLISAWDFQVQPLDTPLAQAVIARATSDLEQPVEQQLDRTGRDRHRRWFGLALLLVAGLGCVPWFSFARLALNANRTWLGLSDVLFPVSYTLEPSPGRHVCRLGDSVNVRFRMDRRVTDRVVFVIAAGERVERREVALGSDLAAVCALTSSAEVEYRVRVAFGRRETADVNLVFTTPPVLNNMQTELVYPAYTRLLPRTLEGVQPRLVGLAGTRITLGFTFSKTLTAATFTWDDGETLPLDVVGRFASTTIMHSRQRRASLQVQDAFGFGLEYPVPLEFELQADEKPRLFLPKHLKEDMPMLAAEVAGFGFGVRAEDDFGVTRCLLKWQKSTVDSPNQVVDRGEIERLVSPPQRKTVVSFEKVFAGLALQPGDKLTFTVEAHDNCQPDRQVTRSRPASLFIFREELGGLSIRDLGFGGDAGALAGRIGKAQRATSVQEPLGLQVREQVRNEFEAAVSTGTRAPTVRGEFGGAARDYFRLLSGVTLRDETERDRKPPAGGASAPQAGPP